MTKKTRKKRSPNKKQYFTLEVDKAIIKYNESKSLAERNKLYNDIIHPAFDKLCENLINTFKWPFIEESYDDLKSELVTGLTEKLYKFKQEAGKAYSYYSIVGKNYLIAKNNKLYKKAKTYVGIDVIDEERDLNQETARQEYKEALKDYMDIWVDHTYKNIDDLFTEIDDIAIADSILQIFKKRNSIDTFNKKGLYVLIREQTDHKTQRITNIVSILKEDFYKGFSEYNKR